MSSSINKEWIDNENIESDSYIAGVCNFIQFMVANSGGKKLFSCPCRRCLNGRGQRDVEFISVHLFQNGMDKSYTSWYFHGEDTCVNQSLNEPEHEIPVVSMFEVADNVLPTSELQLHDVCDDGNISNLPETFSAPETHKESKYERLKRISKKPLFPTSTHSIMDTLVKVNDLKTEFNLSDAATEGVLGLLKDVLPPKNALGSKLHEMKCTLKEVDLKYVTYDVCERNCRLFWKEHSNSTHCDKCTTSRYKMTRVDDNGNNRRNNAHLPKFKRVARKVMRYFPIIPRLKRLYSIPWIAEAMIWHHRAQTCGEFMRHPRDSADWRNVNRY